MIHLENLKELDGANLVYIYFSDNAALYCGKTTSFLSRQKEHLYIRGEEYAFCFDKIICLEFENPLLMDLAEIYYINKLKPTFNEKQLYKDNKCDKSLTKLHFIQQEIINRYCIYQFDLYENLQTRQKPNLFSVQIDLIKKMVEKTNSEEIPLSLYLEEVYIPIRKTIMSDSSYKASQHRFKMLEFENKDIVL